jgi:exopolysaccharide production protein ExoQ
VTGVVQPGAVSRQTPWPAILALTAVFMVDQRWTYSLEYAAGSAWSVSQLIGFVEEGDPVRRTSFLLLGVGGAIGLLRSRDRFRLSGIGLLGSITVLFLGWAVVSVSWSDNPSVSIRRLGVFVTMWVAAVAVSQRFRVHDLVVWVFVVTTCYLHIGILAEAVLGTFDPLSRTYRFAGTMHPNVQAINCALLLFASLFLAVGARRWRPVFVAIAFEAVAFLILTKSRSSLGAAAFAMVLAYVLTAATYWRILVLVAGTAVASLAGLFGGIIAPMFETVSTLGRVDTENITLTGRIPIWDQALQYIAERPILGFGYDAFWTPRHLLEIKALGWAVPNAHSVYLDLCLGLGVTGAVLYSLVLIVALARTLTRYRICKDPDSAFLVLVLLFVGLVGITESIVFYGNAVTFLLMATVAILAFSRRGQNGHTAPPRQYEQP